MIYEPGRPDVTVRDPQAPAIFPRRVCAIIARLPDPNSGQPRLNFGWGGLIERPEVEITGACRLGSVAEEHDVRRRSSWERQCRVGSRARSFGGRATGLKGGTSGAARGADPERGRHDNRAGQSGVDDGLS